jgi:SAM-dependent methyltransferase
MTEHVHEDPASAYRKVEDKYKDTGQVSAYEDNRFGRPGGRYLNETQVAIVLDFLGDTPLSVLEAGCGTGRFTFAMAKAGHRVTGLDYSEAMLDVCRGRKAEDPAGERVELIEGDVFALPFADGMFDATLCMHVLMHLPGHEDVLLELLRVTKPGGLVVFDIRNARSLNHFSYPFRRLAQRLLGRKPWYLWYATVDEVSAFARAHGAGAEHLHGIFPLKPNKLPASFLPLLRWLETAPEHSFRRRAGHIQMIALRKDAGVA